MDSKKLPRNSLKNDFHFVFEFLLQNVKNEVENF